ncbi:MAG: hypothetical protein ACPG6V_12670 [Flavobacteriales bacterium]
MSKKEIIELSSSRIFQLYLKFTTVNYISKLYSISKADGLNIYKGIRKSLRRGLFLRAIVYLVIGLLVGYLAFVGTFVQGNFILWGAILLSIGCIISGFCFLLTIVSSFKK